MSRFAIDLATLRARLPQTAMSPESLALMLDYIDEDEAEEIALWIDEPWADVDYADLETDSLVAVVVFTEPLELDEGLELRDEQLLGFHQARDGAGWVFLSAVRCTIFTTLPDAVSVFAGGLEVDGIACFAAPDAATYVEKKLKAGTVLSGLGDGSVSIVPGAALEIGVFQSYLSCAGQLEPELQAQLDDAAGWEVVSELIG